MRQSIYTISNALTLYRLCAAPVIAGVALAENRELFVGLMLVSLFTDAIDGFLARWRHEETRLGARLDALADSATMGAGLVGLWVFERAPLQAQPFWLLLFLGTLAAATLISIMRFRRLPAFHLYSFKLADIGLTGFFLSLFLYRFVEWVYIASMSFAALAALEIAVVALVLRNYRTDIKGLWWVLQEQRNRG